MNKYEEFKKNAKDVILSQMQLRDHDLNINKEDILIFRVYEISNTLHANCKIDLNKRKNKITNANRIMELEQLDYYVIFQPQIDELQNGDCFHFSIKKNGKEIHSKIIPAWRIERWQKNNG